VASTTEIRKTGYDAGRSLASELLIQDKAEAATILLALEDEDTMISPPVDGDKAYVEAFIKGFKRRLADRCETFISYSE